MQALAAALMLAALSTLYDFVWAYFRVPHHPVYGLVHGMTLLSAAGLALGWRAGRPGAGTTGGALAGLLAAATFYLIAGVLGYRSALLFAWVVLWLLFAGLAAWLREGAPLGREPLIRGIAAAALSGTAFWLISGIWTNRDPGGPDYAWNFACWTFAYFPGFASLWIGAFAPSRQRRSASRN